MHPSNTSRKRSPDDENLGRAAPKNAKLRATSDDGQSSGCAGEPPAWAPTRADLCETIPWFKQYQAGVQSSPEMGCYGLLIDDSGGERTYIDDEIIITRLPGAYEIRDDELILVRDQSLLDGTSKAIKKSFDIRQCIGVVLGDRNKNVGLQLPHRYCVLDFFVITHIWPEKKGDYIGYMMRLQKRNLNDKSWWAAKGSPDPPSLSDRDFQTRPQKIRCPSCGVSSERVFKEDWMCLQQHCNRFWKIAGKPPTTPLEYDPVFLAHRFFWNEGEVCEKAHLTPEPPVITDASRTDWWLGKFARQGIVCPLCRKCVPRIFWDGWRCTVSHTVEPHPRPNEPDCPYSLIVRGPSISVLQTIVAPDSETNVIRRHYGKSSVLPGGGLNSFYQVPRFSPEFRDQTVDRHSLKPYLKIEYKLEQIGTVTHIVSNTEINSQPNGSDNLFFRFQELNLGLRRERLSMSRVKGMMTAHFLKNFGLPYKFVVPLQTQPLSTAPEEVLIAHNQLAQMTQTLARNNREKYRRPNELLIVGYVQNMNMGWHDDGEDTLGPTIATLSLGATATMFIRMKAKYYTGFTPSGGVLRDDPVLPGCHNYDARMLLKSRYDQGELTDKQYLEERKKVLSSKVSATPIKLELHHGHMVVMHGEGLQKFYEHSVVPDGGVRFAVTARHIKEELFTSEDIKMGQYTLKPGK